MSDAPKSSFANSIARQRRHLTSTSSLDYVTILLKQGFADDQVAAVNSLWLHCGLKRILLGSVYYNLREMEAS